MDWASFIPSVITGGLCGVFISRARYWKHKYHREQTLNRAMETQLAIEHDKHNLTVHEYEDALKQARSQYLAAQQHSVQMATSPSFGADSVADFLTWKGQPIGDDVLEKILRDVNAQPKTYVIQEEI